MPIINSCLRPNFDYVDNIIVLFLIEQKLPELVLKLELFLKVKLPIFLELVLELELVLIVVLPLELKLVLKLKLVVEDRAIS